MPGLGWGFLRKRRTARMVSSAARAAKGKRWRDAASSYEEALRLSPDRVRLHIQAGHMWKEAGDFAQAERHYDLAWRAMPDDADLALQRGHFFHVDGRLNEAVAAYEQAIRLRPDWQEAQGALARLETVTLDRSMVGENALVDDGRLLAPAPPLLLESLRNRLLPEYLPADGGRSPSPEGVFLRRLGRVERSPWGLSPTLQGIEAIMAHCVTGAVVNEVQLLIGGHIVHRQAPTVHPFTASAEPLSKYTCNLWIDFSSYIPGRYHIEIAFRTTADRPSETRLSHRGYVVILPPADKPDLPGSEAWTPPVDPGDPRSLAEQINARPSIIRPARSPLLTPPQAILILRTDQLGDLSVSVPALRRLRALAPGARLVGLLTTANAEAAHALDLFDEIVVAAFPDVAEERQRVMTVAEQERIRTRLAAYQFDIAIDLAPANSSRGLLLLAGAKLTIGFGKQEFPWLGANFDFEVRDARGRASVLPSSARTLALIEAVGTLFTAPRSPDPSPAEPDAALTHFGFAHEDRLVVLHDGARIRFSRWPHYATLAAQLLLRDVKVVLLSDDPETLEDLPRFLREHPGFRFVGTRLPFEVFDALLSSCILFVGNDTGPKHLAALRGANVISIHSARTNWGEWGQDRGTIITRQLPCAACHIYHDVEECGRDFVCVKNITVEEVMAAADTYL